MMALATAHKLPVSSSTFPSVPSSWSRGGKATQFSHTFHPVGRKDRLFSLRCRPYSSVEASHVLGPKSKFKIWAFKGNSRHDDSGCKADGSKYIKNPVKVSYLQEESEDSSVESSKVQNVVPAPYTTADDTTTGSLVTQNLFKKWLMLLLTPSKTAVSEGEGEGEALEEPSPVESSETPQNTLQKQEERGEVLKAVWCYFLGLDATIKIPMLVFAPLYLAISIVCGPEVSKELTPLWILGPLTMALYVKSFHAICGLYVFAFEQTVKIVKNLPAYSHEYVFGGKLKPAMRTYIWQPLADVKNMGYKEAGKRMLKYFQGWLLERYLDFIELIWPYYNKIIRFMKRANYI